MCLQICIGKKILYHIAFYRVVFHSESKNRFRMIFRFINFATNIRFLPNIRPNKRLKPIIYFKINFRKNNRFYRIFGFDRLFKILFFSEKITDFTDHTEYSVLTDYSKFNFNLNNVPVLLTILGFFLGPRATPSGVGKMEAGAPDEP
jgi:hypothetical protein